MYNRKSSAITKINTNYDPPKIRTVRIIGKKTLQKVAIPEVFFFQGQSGSSYGHWISLEKHEEGASKSW